MPATVVESTDLDSELRFFIERVGYRVRWVRPADDPRHIVVERDGHELELRRSARNRPVHLCIDIDTDVDNGQLTSPGGSIVDFRAGPRGVEIPVNRPTLTVVESNAGAFGVGRAGMQYRDLLPDRWGGRFIASHIRIEEGGDVADWVHFHRVRFQMIYVAAGWVDVVYEGQGAPFRMVAGDCVLQPPEIRHRVLRSSAGLEVIEIGCPAEHDTIADHDRELPTTVDEADRDFSGQRFVRHIAEGATLSPWVDPSLWYRDTGIGQATSGLAGAVVVHHGSDAPPCALTHEGEYVQVVGLAGTAHLDIDGRSVDITASTAVAIPPAACWSWTRQSVDHRALVVSLPADAVQAIARSEELTR